MKMFFLFKYCDLKKVKRNVSHNMNSNRKTVIYWIIISITKIFKILLIKGVSNAKSKLQL